MAMIATEADIKPDALEAATPGAMANSTIRKPTLCWFQRC